MGSIQSEIECNRCNSDNGFEDFNYKTGEMDFFCHSCGCYESHRLKRNDNGTLFYKNPKRGHGYFNMVWVHRKNYDTLGVYDIKLENKHRIIDSILKEEDIESIKKDFYSNEKGVKLTINKFINGEIITEIFNK